MIRRLRSARSLSQNSPKTILVGGGNLLIESNAIAIAIARTWIAAPRQTALYAIAMRVRTVARSLEVGCEHYLPVLTRHAWVDLLVQG